MNRPAFPAMTLLALAFIALLGPAALSQSPPAAVDLKVQRERARQLLADSMRGPDPGLIQARAKAARRLFAEAGDPLGEALSLLAIGATEVLLGDFAAGQAAFDRATEIVAASPDVMGTAIVRMSEAATWKSVEQYDKALAGLEETVEALLQLECGDAELSLESLRYFAPQQFPPEVLEQVDPFLELLKPVIFRSLQSMALLEIAGIQRQQGLLEEALETLVRAQGLTDPQLGGVDPILVEKADVEVALGRPARALELYEAALPLARRRGDLALQARILRGLAGVHEGEGKKEEAAGYRERADALLPQGNFQ